jgi:hypothetical protein
MRFKNKREIQLIDARKRKRDTDTGRLFPSLNDDNEEDESESDHGGSPSLSDHGEIGEEVQAEESFRRCDNCSRMGIELCLVKTENVNFRLKFSCM